MLGHQGPCRLRFERHPSRETLEQHHAGGIQVTARIELRPRELLGRHVIRCADRHAGLGEALPLRRIGESRDPEVHHLQKPARLHDDILRLDVAVDHTLGVCDLERAAQLLPDRQRDRRGQLAA